MFIEKNDEQELSLQVVAIYEGCDCSKLTFKKMDMDMQVRQSKSLTFETSYSSSLTPSCKAPLDNCSPVIESATLADGSPLPSFLKIDGLSFIADAIEADQMGEYKLKATLSTFEGENFPVSSSITFDDLKLSIKCFADDL